MSKHPRKSRHRIPQEAFQSAEPCITERYQAEIDRSVGSLTRRYRRAEQALQKATAKRERLEKEWARTEKAERDPAVKDRVWRNLLEVIAEQERANDDFWGYHALMHTGNTAPAKNRGRNSYTNL